MSAFDVPTAAAPQAPAAAGTLPGGLIAVDWGSSNLRAWLLDAQGAIVDHRRSDQGLLHVSAAGGADAAAQALRGEAAANTPHAQAFAQAPRAQAFAQALRAQAFAQAPRAQAFAQALRAVVGPWLGPHSRVLMAGMVGSRQGWVEAPYAATPAGTAELAAALVRVPFDVPCCLVPGVATRAVGAPAAARATGVPAAALAVGAPAAGGAVGAAAGAGAGGSPAGAGASGARAVPFDTGAPDVMRGEETQLAGLPEGTAPTGLAVLPGTHSKWVWREQGRIVWFRTFMTGELFDLLVHHSILGRSMLGDSVDEAAFELGLAAARQPGGLLEKLFAVRARWLFGELAAEAQRDFLSGLLIGTECANGLAAVAREAGPQAAALLGAVAAAGMAPVQLVASPVLAGRYRRALQGLGLAAITVDESATARGLWRIACQVRGLPDLADVPAPPLREP
jgi:2-dehydro-3-deoxygalactonokinase